MLRLHSSRHRVARAYRAAAFRRWRSAYSARRRSGSRPSRRAAAARGAPAPRYPVQPARLRLDGRLWTRPLRGGRLCGRRHDRVPAQTGRDRRATGRCRGQRDRSPRWRPGLDIEPLWWPPAKIVGRYLTPFLAAKLGLAETVVGPLREGAIPVEVELDPRDY